MFTPLQRFWIENLSQNLNAAGVRKMIFFFFFFYSKRVIFPFHSKGKVRILTFNSFPIFSPWPCQAEGGFQDVGRFSGALPSPGLPGVPWTFHSRGKATTREAKPEPVEVRVLEQSRLLSSSSQRRGGVKHPSTNTASYSEEKITGVLPKEVTPKCIQQQ